MAVASVATRRTQRSKRGLLELAGAIECSTGRSALAYMMYGCYCGLGGQGWPRDRADWWGTRFNHTPERAKIQHQNIKAGHLMIPKCKPSVDTLTIWSAYALCDAKDIIQHACLALHLTDGVNTLFPPGGFVSPQSWSRWPKMLGGGTEGGGVVQIMQPNWYFEIGPKITHPNPNCRLLLFLPRRKPPQTSWLLTTCCENSCGAPALPSK